jgi:hypothetical protein
MSKTYLHAPGARIFPFLANSQIQAPGTAAKLRNQRMRGSLRIIAVCGFRRLYLRSGRTLSDPTDLTRDTLLCFYYFPSASVRDETCRTFPRAQLGLRTTKNCPNCAIG